jgi:hypothetical protein
MKILKESSEYKKVYEKYKDWVYIFESEFKGFLKEIDNIDRE